MTTLPPSSAPGEDPESLSLGTVESADLLKRPWLMRVAMFSGYTAIGVALIMAVATASTEWALAAVDMLILLGVTHLIARRLAYYDRSNETYLLVMAGFSMKLVGSLLRMLMTTVFYSGIADATEYDLWGKFLAPSYRTLDFSYDVGPFSGTGFLRTITGVLYALTGPSKPGAFMFFGWSAFIGALLLWRAFMRAVPEGDARRYAFLVLFLPSMIYWPSALGKDAWAVFSLGLISYGVARVMSKGALLGFPIAALGLVSAGLLRPHVALITFVGMVLAAGLGKSRSPSARTPFARIFVFGILFVVGTVLIGQTSQFFGVSGLNQETVNETLRDAEGRTSKEAGSTFTPVSVTNNPANFPLATVTILYRPFPFEVGNVQSLLSAGEGVFLMWLTWNSRRRLRNLWNQMRYSPYVAYSFGIVLSFIYAFSAFSNFGILARQRVQVMPFFLVLLCLPERKVEPRKEFKALDPSSLVAPRENPYQNQVAPNPYAAHEAEQHAIDNPYERFQDDTQPRKGRFRRG